MCYDFPHVDLETRSPRHPQENGATWILIPSTHNPPADLCYPAGPRRGGELQGLVWLGRQLVVTVYQWSNGILPCNYSTVNGNFGYFLGGFPRFSSFWELFVSDGH